MFSAFRSVASHSRRIAVPVSVVSRTTGRIFVLSSRSHTTDTYSKDVDSSPAADSKIHRVDPSSENVQKPHEPPSGKWSAAGVEAGVDNAQGKKKTGLDEYNTMSGSKPYAAPSDSAPKSATEQRYGGTENYTKEKARNPKESSTSTEGQGPQGAESGGRKPEGR